MFSGKYAVEIPVGERKIFLKTKPCAPLQLDEIRVSYSSVGDSTDLQTSQKVIRSITYHRL